MSGLRRSSRQETLAQMVTPVCDVYDVAGVGCGVALISMPTTPFSLEGATSDSGRHRQDRADRLRRFKGTAEQVVREPRYDPLYRGAYLER